MAIEFIKDLFRKSEPHKGLFAVEKITLMYNLFTTLLIFIMFGRLDHPGAMLIDRVMIAVMTFLLMYLYRLAPCKFSAFVRIAVQMSLLSYWYPDTYEFNRFFPNLDHYFASAEQWLFGCQPSLTFSEVMPYTWFSEAVNMGYFSYYPMILLVAMFYFLHRYELFEKMSFVLVGCFFIYYIIYIFVPVAGPQYYFPAIGMENAQAGVFTSLGDYFNNNSELLPGPGYSDGFFYKLVESSQQVGERPTAAFPSSHVGVSTILMIMAGRVSKRLALCMLPFYICLCCATVYIQAHYLVDAIAGFVTAIIFYVLVSRAFKKWFASSVG
jgi:membrane-associated phospholipid phosphatase